MTKPRSIVIVPEFSFLFFLFSFLRLSFSSSSSPSPSSSSSLPYFARLPSKWRGETLVVPGSFNVIGCWFAREIMSFPLCQTNIVIIPDFREWNEICWMYHRSSQIPWNGFMTWAAILVQRVILKERKFLLDISLYVSR